MLILNITMATQDQCVQNVDFVAYTHWYTSVKMKYSVVCLVYSSLVCPWDTTTT